MSNQKRKKQKLISVIRNNLYMVGKVAKYTPGYFFWMIVSGIIGGAMSSVSAVFSFNLLNAVDAGGDFKLALKIIVSMALFSVAVHGIDVWYSAIQNPYIRRKLHYKMHEELFIKARSLELACFDDPEFYNDFVWAMDQSDKRAVEIMEDTGKLINFLFASATMMGLLFTVDIWVAVVLFVSSAFTVVINLVGNKIGFAQEKELNPLNRKRSYINRIYHLADYAKEIRTGKVSEIILDEYDKNTEKMIEVDRRYGKRYFFCYGFGWQAQETLTFYGILIYMIILLGRGDIMIGGFAASIGVVWTIRWTLVDLVEKLTMYPKHSLYVEKYLEFLRYEPKIKGTRTEVPDFESLELRNASFSYEFSDHPKYEFHDEDYVAPKSGEKREALSGISLTIHKNDKIAIVGYNGAGKTTLIKLIMRLYDPTEGEILYNGINIREFDPEAYREKIGTVFQDFKIYAASIAENVMNGTYNEDTDREKVIAALQKADFTEKLSKLPMGIDTHLTREFNDEGTNLSGGEAQKIAIARVFAGDYPIMIMDEPSSALDPIAEYNLNQSILHYTEDATVIFISHRLSTTRIADRIYMFAEGRLVEQGSHSELLAKKGKYAEMFELQSEKYRDNSK